MNDQPPEGQAPEEQPIDEFELKHLNFELLSLSFAIVQGQFAANKILQQTNHPSFNAENIDRLKQQVAEANQKFERFFGGEIFVDPDVPGASAEEAALFSLLAGFKGNFIAAANNIFNISQQEDWAKDSQNYQLLVAYFTWYAYSEDNYLRKLKIFYEKENLTDLVEQIDLQLFNCSNDIKLVNKFLESLKNPDGPEEMFFQHLMFFIKTIPSYFYSKVHDLNQFIHSKQEFTYKLAEFNDEESALWSAQGFDALTAGYWRAYFFKPEEAKEWQDVGFLAAQFAGGWKLSGFTATEAASWAEFAFTPLLALYWKTTAYTPEDSAILVSHEFHLPSDLPTEAAEVAEIIAKGFQQG